jgi:outer membrane receptor protein involved in Fe transport
VSPRFSTPSLWSCGAASLALFVLACLVFLPTPGRAQVSSGSLAGYVYDPSGALIPNADVEIIDASQHSVRETKTDSTGAYSVAELTPGTYTVIASSNGFGEITTSSVRVLVNTQTRIDFHLPVAGERKTIEVTAIVPQVETNSGALGTVIEQQEIESVPLNRRDFLQLALLAPGVAPPVEGSELSSYGGVAMDAGGGREESNNFLIDGVDNNDPYVNRYGVEPPMDSIQEFKVLTNSYSAEYGRSAAGQVNVITRQGSNDFHGSAYEYLRNRDLDARNFFDPSQTPALTRNQFGFTAGGPVVRNHTFFFGSTDWFRDREGLSQISTVPTGQEDTGNLSALCQTGFNPSGVCNPPPPGSNLSAVQIYNPLNGQAFAGDIIPGGDIPGVAKDILQMYPAAQNSSLSGNYVSSPVQSENDSLGTYRIDHRISEADDLTGRYSFSRMDLFEPWGGSSNGSAAPNEAPGYGDYVKDDIQNAMIQYRHIISSTTVNSASLSYGRFSRDVLPQNYNVNVGALWNVDWLNVPSSGYGYPAISVTGAGPSGVGGLSGAGDNATLPDYRHTNTYGLTDQLALERGSHLLKIGGEFRDLELNGTLDYFNRGELSFEGFASAPPPGDCPAGLTCGAGIADLLLGYPTYGIQSRGTVAINMRSKTYAPYVQDEWRLRPNLTLSLGLRYEYFSPPVDPSNQMYTFDEQTGTVVQVGTNGVPRSGVQSNYHDFAPRVGVAWNVGKQFVVRAGYGIFYDGSDFEVNSAMFFNPPVFNLLLFAGSTLQDPFPTSSGFAVPSPELSVLTPNMVTPYLQQWNLTVERPIASLGTLSLSYAGSEGTHLIQAYDQNQPFPGPGSLQPRRPYPDYGTIFTVASSANSSYNSFQATLNRRMGSYVSLWAAYTWSHSIDDQSAFLDTIPDPNFPQNSHDLAAERADSSFDMRNRLVVASVVQLPHGNRWTRNTEFQTLITAQSGQPFTPVLGYDNSNTGNMGTQSGSDRPNVVGNPYSGACPNGSPVGSATCWFNTSAFAPAPPYTFGDAGRNSLTGPDYADVDAALLRHFAITERFRLTAEAQAFNLFNRVNFKLPDSVYSDPTFGEVLSANPARQIQVALRLAF